MNDLISRQTAIMHFVKASKNYECGMLDLKEITHELWQILSAQPEWKESDWIPCSERLPDKSGDYLVTDDGWPITTVEVGGFFCENGVSEWVSYDHVVAWMPLPEPYKGEL